MKNSLLTLLGVGALVWMGGMTFAKANPGHFWLVVSPDHAQTFTYGTEQNRVWATWGRDRHLSLQLDYTNDPFVSRTESRQYDNFIFNFPTILLGKDGRTFYLHTKDGRSIPVAAIQDAFLGTQIKLLPNAALFIKKPHGYLTLIIEVRGAGSPYP